LWGGVMRLPVDPERLRGEFPDLSDDDLAAYRQVTETVLAKSQERPLFMREVLDGARKARERLQKGGALSGPEHLWVRYLGAVEKMQRSTAKRR